MTISLIAELIINLSGNYTIDELEFFKEKGFITESEYMNYVWQERRSVFTRSNNVIPVPNFRKRPRTTSRKRTILTREEFEKRLEMERKIKELVKRRSRGIYVPLPSYQHGYYDYPDPAINNPMPSQLLYEGPELPGLWDPVLEKNKENE